MRRVFPTNRRLERDQSVGTGDRHLKVVAARTKPYDAQDDDSRDGPEGKRQQGQGNPRTSAECHGNCGGEVSHRHEPELLDAPRLDPRRVSGPFAAGHVCEPNGCEMAAGRRSGPGLGRARNLGSPSPAVGTNRSRAPRSYPGSPRSRFRLIVPASSSTSSHDSSSPLTVISSLPL